MWLSLVEYVVWDHGAGGSNPSTPIPYLDGCGCSSMVEFWPSKPATWVRFPSPAPIYANYVPVAQLVRASAFLAEGRGFESLLAQYVVDVVKW